MEKIIAYAGNDVHQEFIQAALYAGDEGEPRIEKELKNEKREVQEFYKRQGQIYQVRACYEAGSCGYVFYRWLKEIGISCEVIAPSLIPKCSGDRIKTDKRDAKKLGRLYRAGELTAIHIPSEEEEAQRSVIRLRDQIKKEVQQSKQYILKFLQGQGLTYREGSHWTEGHWRYLRGVKLEREEQRYTYQRYIELLEYKLMELRGVEEKVEEIAYSPKYEKAVKKLRCLKGVDVLTAMTLITEVIDFKRFSRPTELMAYVGLVPSQHSSGGKRRDGQITGTGNSRLRRVLIEAAWHYRHAPRVSNVLSRRQEGQSLEVMNYAWKAQKRLHKKFTRLVFKKTKNIAVVAVARELTGFIWSLMVNDSQYSGGTAN